MGNHVSLVQLDPGARSTIPGCVIQIAPSAAISRAIRSGEHFNQHPNGDVTPPLVSRDSKNDSEPKSKRHTRAREEEEDFEEERLVAESPDVKKQKTKEKPPADPEGYRFRKYGKKMIGNEARHYFRCTFPNCEVKRHVTYVLLFSVCSVVFFFNKKKKKKKTSFRNGVADIVVLGDHGHPAPAVHRSRPPLPPKPEPRVGVAPVVAQAARVRVPPPPPPRMMGSLPPAMLVPPVFQGATATATVGPAVGPGAGHAVFASLSTFLAALDEFESSEPAPQKRDVFVLAPDVDHNKDGWCWILKSGGAKMSFGCTVTNCKERKVVVVQNH
jgi:hypothetical protein